MLSTFAHAVVPALGRFDVTTDVATGIAPGSIIAPNHTSLVDPGLILAAVRRLGAEPVFLAAAGLWRIPVLGHVLAREGHVPVRRGTDAAAGALDAAAEALAGGRVVILYPEGRLPRRPDSGEAEPGPFRTGLARLALATSAPVVPVGQAGARRVTSGSRAKQVTGLLTAPLRRPALHVHVGAPVQLAGDVAAATAHARAAVTGAWRKAVARLGPHAAAVSREG
ncbi:lysophospholipid acyltransferase family protein [Streptomyces syringium]|uniref:lysophospholipid acyltransferase family protein n=1 Tax=Streptomyces syringium TaxID=76729 RepID=UPI001AE5EF6F|nr:lysophospholipid acyltransferase family protein [Streptomyces syringium]